METIYTLETVRAQIERFATGELSPFDFETWPIPLIWPDEGDADVLDLAWEVELRLCEISRGHLTVEDAGAMLRSYATEHYPRVATTTP